MSVSYQELKAYVDSLVKGDNLAGGYGYAQIINDAGEHLSNCHDWHYREEAEATVPLVGEQDFITLPEDLMEVTTAELSGTFKRFVFTTPQQMQALKARDAMPSAGVYYGVVIQPPQPNQTSPMPAKRIKLYPAPPADVDESLSIWYRSKWRTLSQNDQIANIPHYCVPLLRLLVKAFALGHWDEDRDTTDKRLAELHTHPTFLAAVRADGMRQDDDGPVLHGAARSHETYGGFATQVASLLPPD